MSELDPLRWAKFFATIKHTYFSKKPSGQMYGGLPYTHHLAAVEAVYRRFDKTFDGIVFQDMMLEVCWLHDVLEDTHTKKKDIVELFGETVADLVEAVTDEPGTNRKERKALTLPKIRKAGLFATRVKLADRIANVEQGGDLVKMYQKEYEDFRHALHVTGENEDMWVHLDSLMG